MGLSRKYFFPPAVKPEDPVKEGYIFDGWYKVTGDTMADEPYDFDTEVTEDPYYMTEEDFLAHATVK